MRRMLMVATVPSMIGQFNRDNIGLLQGMGYEVHVAADFTGRSVWTEDMAARFREGMEAEGVACFQVGFSRQGHRLDRHLAAYRELLALVREHGYDFIHTHTPTASAIARIVGHRTGTRVIYTAHGFHFFRGAPLLNWLLYYPVERFLSRWTDVLITINREDYRRARESFHAGEVRYVPGVGIDLGRFSAGALDGAGRKAKREELGVGEEDIMLISVGELNRNKNHEIVIRALKKMGRPDIRYFICGQGESEGYLRGLIRGMGLQGKVQLLGYRDDVPELHRAADLFVFPSRREGLSVALMEAVAARVPVACSKIRGNVDVVTTPDSYFDPASVGDAVRAIETIASYSGEERARMTEANYASILKCQLSGIRKEMMRIYGNAGAPAGKRMA